MSRRYQRRDAARLVPLFIAVVLTASGLSACGGADSQPRTSDERPASVIGDPLHQALDRAESVQNTLDERAEDLRERLEAAEGN